MVGTGMGSDRPASESPSSILPDPPSLIHGASLCATMAKFGQEFHFPPSSDGRQIPFGDNDADRGATSAKLERQQKPPSLRFATLHVVLSGVTHSNRPPPFPLIAIFTVIRNGRARRGEEKGGTIHK